MTFRVVLFTFFCFVFSANSFAQNNKLDSLNSALAAAANDSLKSEIYFRLSEEVKNTDVNQSLEYLLKCIEYAKMASAPRLMAAGLNNLGIIYYTLGDFEKTLDHFYQVLTIYETIDDLQSLARIYNNVGLILLDLGRTEETVEYYNKSLDIKRDLKDTFGIANTLTNLGLVYYGLNKPDTAFAHFQEALTLDLILKKTLRTFKDNCNIGDTNVIKN
mgnify:FL=1